MTHTGIAPALRAIAPGPLKKEIWLVGLLTTCIREPGSPTPTIAAIRDADLIDHLIATLGKHPPCAMSARSYPRCVRPDAPTRRTRCLICLYESCPELAITNLIDWLERADCPDEATHLRNKVPTAARETARPAHS